MRARGWALWIALLIVLLAFALRLHKLDAQSLWYDEGNSARIAERSVQLILEGAAGDIHPPLYYLLLKVWRLGAGGSEMALRSLSAFASVLTVAVIFAWGSKARQHVGAAAALLLAASPFSVYYAQEARMYALLALWAALSTWAWANVRQRMGGFDALFVLSTAAGLYTHYAYPFVIAAQALGTLLGGRCARAGLARLARFGLLGVGALVLFAPWLPVALRQLGGWDVARERVGAFDALLTLARTLVVGRTLPAAQSAVPLVLWLGAAALGALSAERKGGMRAQGVALLFVPAALLVGLGAYREAYLKFVLVSVAPLCLLSALGASNVAVRLAHPWAQRGAMLLGTAALVVSVLPALRNLYDDPTYARDDYRGLQRWIAARARPDDAVLFLAPNQWEVYTYYQGNDRNLYPLRYRPERYDQVAQQLEAITAAHPRLFVIYYGEREADPEGWYEQWLNANAFKAHEHWVGNVRVAVYGSSQLALQTLDLKTPIRFGEAIALVGAHVGRPPWRAGDVLPLELHWQALTPIPRRYKVFVHVGEPNAPPKAQFDSEPRHGNVPTSAWQPDAVVVDRRGVWLEGVSPGETIAVFLGLYDADTGVRLPIASAPAEEGRLPLFKIRVAP